jgi:hypothetical protein
LKLLIAVVTSVSEWTSSGSLIRPGEWSSNEDSTSD